MLYSNIFSPNIQLLPKSSNRILYNKVGKGELFRKEHVFNSNLTAQLYQNLFNQRCFGLFHLVKLHLLTLGWYICLVEVYLLNVESDYLTSTNVLNRPLFRQFVCHKRLFARSIQGVCLSQMLETNAYIGIFSSQKSNINVQKCHSSCRKGKANVYLGCLSQSKRQHQRLEQPFVALKVPCSQLIWLISSV